MTVLLDTQILLWSQAEPHRLPRWLFDQLDQPDYTPCFSVISIWEVVIKASLKRKDFDYDPYAVRTILIDRGWRELVLTSDHVLAVSQMPQLHGDPFDRALIAQAQVEGLEFVTADRKLKGYGSHVQIV
jgi:PIN domain nuclease of toxin-antitoxin system